MSSESRTSTSSVEPAKKTRALEKVESIAAAISPKAITRQLRKTISKDRHRFQDFDFDLDLSYITPNVIAMGFPSSGIESLWRNNIDEVCKMLTKYHGDKFMIWNLSGREYDYEKFNNQILDFGFPDHHSPPLEVLFKIVLSMSSFLGQNSDNVSVVHCMGGKGRTGTVIACYLLYCGLFKEAVEALAHFARQRSSIAKGVVQASQLRYTKYFGEIVNRRMKPDFRKVVCLKSIEFRKGPAWTKKKTGLIRPVVEIYSTHHYPKKLLYSTPTEKNTVGTYKVGDNIVFPTNCVVQSDILILVSKYKEKKKHKKMFRFSFHCAFIEEGVLILKPEEFDTHGGKKLIQKLSEQGFEMLLHFTQAPRKLGKMDNGYEHDAEVNKLINSLHQQTEAKEELQSDDAVTGVIKSTMGIPERRPTNSIPKKSELLTSLNQISDDMESIRLSMSGDEKSLKKRTSTVSIGKFRESGDKKAEDASPNTERKEAPEKPVTQPTTGKPVAIPEGKGTETVRWREARRSVDMEGMNKKESPNTAPDIIGKSPENQLNLSKSSSANSLSEVIPNSTSSVDSDDTSSEDEKEKVPEDGKAEVTEKRASSPTKDDVEKSIEKIEAYLRESSSSYDTETKKKEQEAKQAKKNPFRESSIGLTLIDEEDEVILEDPNFMDELCKMLDEMETERRRHLERSQLHNQQQQQKRKSQVIKPSEAPKIQIGRWGMM